MARIRYLKPGFFLDEDLKDLPFEGRLFYAGLWCHADKAGRLEDRPERLKIEIMPYDDVNAEELLAFLQSQKKVAGLLSSDMKSMVKDTSKYFPGKNIKNPIILKKHQTSLPPHSPQRKKE